MNNLSIALAMIMATETPNMNCKAVGDLHLPVSRRAFGRMQIRKTVLDDLNNWTALRKNAKGLVYTREDSMNPKLDVIIAAWWLQERAGKNASIRRYLTTWNGGRVGRNTDQAQAYYRRAIRIKKVRADYFQECLKEVKARF